MALADSVWGTGNVTLVDPSQPVSAWLTSAWGTEDATLAGTVSSGGWATSAWGTANSSVASEIPSGGLADSAWGVANATLTDPGAAATGSPVVWINSAWAEAEAVYWDQATTSWKSD